MNELKTALESEAVHIPTGKQFDVKLDLMKSGSKLQRLDYLGPAVLQNLKGVETALHKTIKQVRLNAQKLDSKFTVPEVKMGTVRGEAKTEEITAQPPRTA